MQFVQFTQAYQDQHAQIHISMHMCIHTLPTQGSEWQMQTLRRSTRAFIHTHSCTYTLTTQAVRVANANFEAFYTGFLPEGWVEQHGQISRQG